MATSGVYRYRRTATFGCGTPVSTTVDIPVYSTAHNAGSITSSNICRGQTVSIANAASATTGTPASSGPVYSWHRATGPGFGTWTPLSGTGASFSQIMNTAGVYRYRRTATFGCGTPVTTTVDVTVFSTANVAGAIDGNDACPGDPIIISNVTAASTGTPASSGPNYSWRRAPGPGFTSWTTLTGSGDSFTESLATPGTYRYRRTATFGCGSTVSTTTDINVFSTTHNPGSISNTTACAEAHSQLQASPLLQPETCIIRTNIQLGESPGSSVHRMGCTSGYRCNYYRDYCNPRSIPLPPYCNLRMRNTCNHHCRCNGLFDHSQRGCHKRFSDMRGRNSQYT